MEDFMTDMTTKYSADEVALLNMHGISVIQIVLGLECLLKRIAPAFDVNVSAKVHRGVIGQLSHHVSSLLREVDHPESSPKLRLNASKETQPAINLSASKPQTEVVQGQPFTNGANFTT